MMESALVELGELQRFVHHTWIAEQECIARAYATRKPAATPGPIEPLVLERDQLFFAANSDGIAVECHVETPWRGSEPWDRILSVLAQAAVADHLLSLVFTGPDVGANGCRGYEFDAWLDSDA